MIGFRLAIAVFSLLVVQGVGHAAGTSHTVQADKVLTDVDVQGARVVLSELWLDNDQWNQVIRNIGRGNEKWLKIAARLRPVADAGSAEELDEAIFFALQPAPVAVLRLFENRKFITTAVCNSNVGNDYSSRQSIDMIEQRIVILKRLTDRHTLMERNKCLAGLESALADFHRARRN